MDFIVVNFEKKLVILDKKYSFKMNEIALFNGKYTIVDGRIVVSGKEILVDWNFVDGVKTIKELMKYRKGQLKAKPYRKRYGFFYHKVKIIKRWVGVYPTLSKSVDESNSITLNLSQSFNIINKINK